MKAAELRNFILLSALWGASFLFMRMGAEDFGPVPLIALRVGIASLFLVLFLQQPEDWLSLRQNLPSLILLGTIYSALPFSLIAYATLHLNAGFAAIVNSTTPIFGMLVAAIWLRERCTLLQVLGLILGFSGVWVLVSGKLATDHSDPVLLPVLAGLSAACSYGLAAGYSKRYMQAISPMVNAAGTQLGASLVLILPAIWLWPQTNPSLQSWVSVIALGLGCTGLAYMLFFRLVANIGPQRSVMVTYLVPIFAMFWGAIFLQEVIDLSMLLGCIIILLGTALATELLRGRRKSLNEL